ncbi:methyltransferase [Microbacterium betulae]|uniref:Methyltransferase n=1 Tax=Microbacterium betulae TaxID=2981139 RepID=A0AA97FKG7_9MICO|nr:methyltransferase [Microbacterium sp. AB]WOF24551.1 methyltransferase [Microbacterium sp. AB]
MTTTQARRLWVAHGAVGAVGSIREHDGEFEVRMVGADAPVGRYPELEIAKRALQAHLKPGAERPEFRRH